jgi:iron complex outermembrane receptor protein
MNPAICWRRLGVALRNLVLAAVPCFVPLVSAAERVTLFDGKSLAGWDGDTTVWRVLNGAIVGGSLAGNPRNEFLTTTRTYRDFVLRFDYKLIGTEGFINGGVQVRSRRLAQPAHEMSGYQADIGAGHSGSLYDESRRKKFLVTADPAVVARAEKAGEWNRYEVRCEGPRIQLFLNGVRTVDYTEVEPGMEMDGVLGLQIHGNCKAEISFRDLSIEELAPNPVAERKPEATRGTGTIAGRVQNVITGKYLNKARVSVKGTTLSALTDDSGTYRIAGVPAGTAVLDVFYTGLDPQQVPVEIAASSSVTRDVALTNAGRYGQSGDAVALDPLVVSAARDTNAHSIAINEQRFAPNLKNVVSTDAFGDVTDGNVGEFLKFLPGISTGTNPDEAGTVTTASVRGFAANMTRVSYDGSQLANTGSASGNDRTFYFGQVSTNNLARVEVIKSPTPADPADTLAGSVNLVSKSAFERKEAQLNYSLSLSASSQSLSLGRKLYIHDKRIHKILPGLTFDYTLPVNRNFGLVVTGQNMDRYVDSVASTPSFSRAPALGASTANPVMQSFRWQEGPRVANRRSLGVRADWRLQENSVLTFAAQTASFLNKRSTTDLFFNVGTAPTPTVAGGRSLTFGPDFVSGATGRGQFNIFDNADFQQPGRTRGGNLRYRFDNGTWKVEAIADYSISTGATRYASASPGRFRNMAVRLNAPAFRVDFSNIGEIGPRTIRVFDNNEREIDLSDIRNYQILTASDTPRDFDDELKSGRVDLRRRFSAFPFPTSLQVGSLIRTQSRDVRRHSAAWNYTGPTDLSYLVTRYAPPDPRFNRIPWMSVEKAWDAYQKNPSWFTQTAAQQVTNRANSIGGSEFIDEQVDAHYAQIEIQPLTGLTVLGGVRYEKTAIEGLGPLVDPSAVWVRNPDGSFARTAAGARIRKAEAGAAGSMQELELTRKERGFAADRSYRDYYPSVHATYAIRSNVLARASFAATYGRPNFTEIIPNTQINDLDAGGSGVGSINVRNPGLKPWSAKNYDLSLEYYTDQGGLFGVSVFRKDISDFFANSVRNATEGDLRDLELDSQYLGWEISTRANAGDARVDGIELNLQHSLAPLGKWGRPFHVFLNGTKLHLTGTERGAFDSFVPESVNWGVGYSHKRFRIMARWNHRGEEQRGITASIGINGARYVTKRTLLDLNCDFRVTPRLTLFANVQNLGEVSEQQVQYGDETPAYARVTGDINTAALLTFGIKGSF